MSNPSKVCIFDPNVSPNRDKTACVGFQGTNCDVLISLGGMQFPCQDHRISCNLRHSMFHAVSLLVSPWPGVTDWFVELQWTNKAYPIAPIMDETLQEIITYPMYRMGMIGVPTDTTKIDEKNSFRKIITELSNKAFLENRSQESKVLEVLEAHYQNMKLY